MMAAVARGAAAAVVGGPGGVGHDQKCSVLTNQTSFPCGRR
jgi:hypothetical protein